MKIQKIELNNYKAFYGKQLLNVSGKNVFIYGENGSGKSSLYYALKDFFQSSIETINLSKVENIFIEPANKGNVFIKVSFKPDKDGKKRGKTYEFSTAVNDTRIVGDTSIRDANSLKSFLTYKHLLDIHHIKSDKEIDLFSLLVKGVLKHFKYTLTAGKELGALWSEVERLLSTETNRSYNLIQKKREVNAALLEFDTAFNQLFISPTASKPNPEYLLDHAKPILELFDNDIELILQYKKGKLHDDYTGFKKEPTVNIDLKYAGKPVEKPHLFLNEARLSAIAISIYLGMIKRHPQLKPYKILFLDDIFIGLDISNRLPLLKIIDTHFIEYQIFITTYDKPWYEFVKSFLEGKAGWVTIEFYATKTHKGYEIPRIVDNSDYLAKADQHVRENDYKSAAVYTRTAFEREVQKFCDRKNIPVPFHKQAKKYTSENFWNAIKGQGHLLPPMVTDIEQYRDLVLNAFSHYNTEKHEIRRELTSAIIAIKNLKVTLDAIV